MKILVIEDNPMELKLARHVLSAAGHSVNGAGAYEEAIKVIKNDMPQVILLDLYLPGMDGLTLLRKLKADARTRHIQVIAVTSFPERYSRHALLDAGCNGYLVKPLSTRMLAAQVCEVADAAGQKCNATGGEVAGEGSHR
jgi:CheY-like chemotaxis protein